MIETPDGKELATTAWRPGERLRALWREFKGRPFLDIRVFWSSDGEKWFPSKKGITVSPARLEDFQAVIAKALPAARKLAEKELDRG